MRLADKIKAVHALRTTTARQIRFELSDGRGGRCANGVICDAFGIDVDEWVDGGVDGSNPYDELKAMGVPVSSLYLSNDTLRRTFAEIADWIEANVPVDDDPTVEIEHYANTAPVLVGV